jgi:tetratricopeptide (TPR) repeat protein
MDALKKSLVLNKESKNMEGILRDYFDMARRTDNELYIIKGLAFADSLHLARWMLRFKELMLSYKMVIKKNPDEAITYLDNQADLKVKYMNSGIADYYWIKGEIYKYGGKIDSALYYLKRAEPDLLKNFNTQSAQQTYFELAETYALNNDKQNAISYYEKSLALSNDLGDFKSIAVVSYRLSKLYEEINDYKKSLSYSRLAILYKDTLQQKTRERDIALLGVESERKKHEADVEAEKQKTEKSINLQYMAITVVISIVFVFILFLGFFPVSKTTIRILGYFFFISLFEFFVLLIDNTILGKFTHGQPLKLWLIKIGLIACLVPLQHLLEHRMIKFLESRSLLEVKKKFSIMKIWRRKEKPAPVISEAGIEEMEQDTAVL